MGLIEARGVSVRYPSRGGGGEILALRGVSFAVSAGEALGIVGESGCGKTSLILALMGLLPGNAQVAGAFSVGDDHVDLGQPDSLSRWRGRKVGLIFQDPDAALNPVMPVGRQLAEALPADLARPAARARTAELLERVGLGRELAEAYPHQLSGGQKQRVMIASALAGQPQVLLADEPTTALDVLAEAQILSLLGELRRALQLAVVLISHDLDLVSRHCDQIAVLYQGQVVEAGEGAMVLEAPAHPYTALLERAMPRLHRPPAAGAGQDGVLLPWGPGCAYASRCQRSEARCGREQPSLAGPSAHTVRCFNPLDRELEDTERQP